MKKLLVVLLVGFISVFTGFEAAASHVSGGSIKYTYVGPGMTAGTHQYRVQVAMVRDCNGIQYSKTSERITAVCMPGGTNQQIFTAPKVNYIAKPGERPVNRGNKDVSDVCSSKSSSCAGNGNPNGYEVSFFEVVITLGSCNYWEIYVTGTECCRNGMVNATGSYYTPMTRLNSAQFPTNSSPNFADEVKPMPSVCVGQNVFYGIGTVDPDGDSLRFYLVAGRDNRTATNNQSYVNYRAGYSITAPIPGLKLDSSTGLISFRTNVTGKFLVSFVVEEYERCTGRWKGTTHREVQFIVGNCSNNVPRDISGISNLQGNAKRIGKYALEVCEGTQITWDDTIVDIDRNDTLLFATNVDSVLKGVTWTRIPIARNQAVVRFTWRANILLGQYYTFFLAFDDDRCDYPGNGFSVFEMNVRPAASAGPDQYVCKGDTAYIDALGGSSFRWHLISGDPMIAGVNWFPDTTLRDTNRTAKFIPTRTTTMWVEVDTLRDACGNLTVANCFTTDTITIIVPDSFSIATVPDFFLCNPGTGQLDVQPSRAFNYKYEWSPRNLVDSFKKKNPTFTNVKYPTVFGITVTSDSGCVREDEVRVNVTDPFPTNMKIRASDTLICLQKNIKLWVDKGLVDYGKLCDTSTYNCQGTFKDFTLGTGTQSNTGTSTNMPMVYGSRWYSGKSQYLYRANELKAMGMKPGPIQQVSWFIQSLYAGLSTPFNSFTIRMRCTSMTALPQNSFVPPGIIVYGPKAYLPSTGWNDHTLDREYNWDGVSNLIVEVCWENGSTRYAAHHIQTFDNKTYAASAHYFQTSTIAGTACPAGSPSAGFPNNTLPRTKFNACVGARSSLFKYDWDPKSNGGFNGATNRDSVNASVNLATASKYYVYVEDSMFGVCKDTLEIDIDVVSSYNTKPDSLGEQCVTSGYIQMTSPTNWKIANPGGRWSGAGIINDTLGIWDPTKSGFGKFWVKYSVTGDACASKDSTLIDIVGLPDVSLIEPDSACAVYGDTTLHILKGRLPGGIFSGKGVKAKIDPNTGDTLYFYLDGTAFNPTPGKPDTAFVRHSLYRGCWHDTIVKIPVVAPWDNTFMGILYNGFPIRDNDTKFCQTSSSDTLAVAGPFAVWRSLNNPGAMIDTLRGVFDPRMANPGNDIIEATKYGFCGGTARIPIFIQRPIEIDVVEEQYCFANGCQGIPFLQRDDTIKVRVPKSGVVLGINDTIVYRGLSSLPGQPDIVDNEDFNKWGGDLNTAPQVARFRPCELAQGNYKFHYTLPVKYRVNHPRDKCYSRDTATIIVRKPPKAPVKADAVFAYCEKDEVRGIYIDSTSSVHSTDYAVEWYLDTNTTPVYIGNPLDTTGLNNSLGGYTLYVRYVDNSAGCSGPYTRVSYKVYASPKTTFSVDKEKVFVGDLLSFTNTTDYSDTNVFFRWYGLNKTSFGAKTGAEINSKLDGRDTSDTEMNKSAWYHRLRYGPDATKDYEKPCEPRDNLTRKINPTFEMVNGRMAPTKFGTTQEKDTLCDWRATYSEYGGYGVWLVGVNDVGCADTFFYGITIDQRVDPKFPNVFTPDGDGINDYWSIIPPVGGECPCPPVQGESNHCYCSEGEALIRELYKRDFLSLEGYIYDRWGRKVFELTLEEPIWKGQNMAGNDQVDGVYFYTLKGVLRTQGEDVLVDPTTGEAPQGTITLIRGK